MIFKNGIYEVLLWTGRGN